MVDLQEIINSSESRFRISHDYSLSDLVHFTKFKQIPFQRWSYYQEGFSSDILRVIIDRLGRNLSDLKVLDPFCGSGSTLVCAKRLGIDSIGIELNPFSFFLSKVKTKNYPRKDIVACKEFSLPRFKNIKNVYKKYELSTIKKLFSEENLIKIELLKDSIRRIDNQNISEILFTSLLCILEECSNYKKAGNGLKKRKQINSQDVNVLFRSKLVEIVEDLARQTSKSRCRVINNDIKQLDSIVEDNSIDLSVFSPPYANCFDYFEVYKIELWLGDFVKSYEELRRLRKTALTSNLNANLKQELSVAIESNLIREIITRISKENLWDKRIPKMLELYFIEMSQFLSSLNKKMKKGGNVAIVVGNSSYAGIPVLTDIGLSEISEEHGFKVKEIIVARRNETASQQYSKIGDLVQYVRESIIILEK